MKATLLLILVLLGVTGRAEAGCSTCGPTSAQMSGQDTGPSFEISLGTAQFGQPAGDLTFDASVPTPSLFQAMLLKYSAATRGDVVVITTNLVSATSIASIGSAAQIGTNMTIYTNCLGTNCYIITNLSYTADVITVTNTTVEYVTNTVLRQIYAPQSLADIPLAPTTNGYVINFYYPSQVGSLKADGTYQLSGSPFITWLITNPIPTSLNQLQVSESSLTDGLLKQWNYAYSTNTGAWTMQTLGGIQENMLLTNLDTSTYQVINTVQYSNSPVAQQVKTTYQIFSWGVAPIRVDVGSDSALKTTTYSYYAPSYFNAGNLTLKQAVIHPDGSQEYYAGYDTNGNPTDIYYTFGDNQNNRQVHYDYNPSTAGVSDSGDDGSFRSLFAPRLTYETVQGYEVSRRYSVYPAASVSLEIQCTTPGAAWSDSHNLFTTNYYYTSGTNENRLRCVVRPDGVATFYDYTNSGSYQTNITVTGQPDAALTHIVDGTSNRVVISQWGYTISSSTWDVKNQLLLAQDTYGNFDSFGRPQLISHLDGTTETRQYACCGLQNAVDRDGVNTVYLYDLDKRQYGYQQNYGGSNWITHQNVLDAAGRTVKALRTGTDNSTLVLNQSAYDLAGELVAQTNALNGGTTYVESTDPNTGGLIRVTTYPDGGTRVEARYCDGRVKSVTGSAVHPVRYEYGVDYDLNNNICTYTAEIKLKDDGTDSSEWTKTYTDMAGRTTETRYAGNGYYDSNGNYFNSPTRRSFYNAKGQLWKQVDPDGVTTLSTYNAKGEQVYTIVAVNESTRNLADYPTLMSSLSSLLGGTDRITRGTNEAASAHGTVVRRSATYAWAQNNVNTATLLSVAETSADGLQSWQVKYGEANGGKPVTNYSVTAYSGTSRTSTALAPDGSYTIAAYAYGRLISTTKYDAIGTNQLGKTSYTYDAHGRQRTVTDARNGTTTYGYNDADQVATVTTPAPGGGQAAQTTTTHYDASLRPDYVTQPDNTTVYSVYRLTGELGLQFGARTYPVGYGYDYAGRMQYMTNWTSYTTLAGARVTTWNYDSQRGWLTNKAFADGNGPTYTYTHGGRLQTRAWVRVDDSNNPITTTYGYDGAGSLTNILYSDATPSVTNSYDRLGRLTQQAMANYQVTSAYNLAGELLTEAYTGGPLAGLAITNGYDQLLQRTNLTALQASTPLSQQSFGYDQASRLQTVKDSAGHAAGYSYVANSALVEQIGFTNGSAQRMTTTKAYDYLNRLTAISSTPAASAAVNFSYNYNAANQRTKNTLVDGSYWVYQYDTLGQVTSGKKYFADGTGVPGQEFDYSFDDIGNRKQTKAGGDSAGSGLRLATYAVNSLNQITSRDYPGTNDVVGVALATNAVTVNGQTAWRKGEYFWSTVGTNNAGGAKWLGVTVASGGTTNQGNLFVAKTPEQFQYDADGNLTNDGHWAYVWDAENRLVRMTVNTNVGPQLQLTFGYDAKSRRIQKVVTSNSVAISTNKFLYDGWNLVAELKPNNTPIRRYTWGTDLSGSMQGAGGVGGLLAVSYYGTATTNCFVAYDGNGNVAALVNAADGTVVANYEYAAFGEPIRISGAMAKANQFRFSTKYTDDESDLLYYGYRYYKASTATWVSRDPLEDNGFRFVQRKKRSASPGDVYLYVKNSPILNTDALGLYPTTWGDIDIGPAIERMYKLCACRNMILKKQQEAEEWGKKYSIPGQTHSNEGSMADMLVHCYMSCELAKNEKQCLAAGYDVRQEFQNREHPESRGGDKMDFENNKIGFGIADSGGDCKAGCLKAFSDGALWTVDRFPPYTAHPLKPKSE